MKKVVVFGASGNTGTYFVKYFLEHNSNKEYEVVAVGTRETHKFDELGVAYYQVDITKKEEFEKLPKDVYAVVDLAGAMPARMKGYNPQYYIDVNITGNLNILEYCRENHADRILFAQSFGDIKDYGETELVLKADMPRKFSFASDHTIYVMTKNFMVDMMENYYEMYGLKKFVFRLPTIYLYSSIDHYYVDGVPRKIGYRLLIDRARAGETIEVWGDPSRVKDMVYVKDFCQMLYKAVFVNRECGYYNVGTGVGTSLLDQIKGMVEVFGEDGKKSQIVMRPDKPNAPQYIMDITPAREELGYSPCYDYISMLKDIKSEMLLAEKSGGVLKSKKDAECGGYIEFEANHGDMIHCDAIALNCGRAALEYLCEAKKIKKLYLPYFLCSSVPSLCKKIGVEYDCYHINEKFEPIFDQALGEDEWLYIVNFYGQLDNDYLMTWKQKYGRVIVDNAQSYFQMPVEGMDTLYTCRKYFGVADGAFLYTNTKLDRELPQDESFERMHFLLGRFERSANEFYSEYVANNKLFAAAPIKQMSRLTENLLRGMDYESVAKRRQENFEFLDAELWNINGLKLKSVYGAFMYPLLIQNGTAVRKELQKEKIYIPTLWPNVLEECPKDSLEYHYATDILPIPVDQRYRIEDMKYLVEVINRVSSERA